MGRGVMVLNAFTGAKIWSTEDVSGERTQRHERVRDRGRGGAGGHQL